jgi:ankyrin repeat protein
MDSNITDQHKTTEEDRDRDALSSASGNDETTSSHSVSKLQTAAKYGDLELVDTMLKAGVDVNAPAWDVRETALQTAAEHGHLKVVDRLVDAGANVNTAKYGARSAL